MKENVLEELNLKEDHERECKLAADRHDKPVYIGPDPMKGTYKRDFDS